MNGDPVGSGVNRELDRLGESEETGAELPCGDCHPVVAGRGLQGGEAQSWFMGTGTVWHCTDQHPPSCHPSAAAAAVWAGRSVAGACFRQVSGIPQVPG